jgi:hypothetical protein
MLSVLACGRRPDLRDLSAVVTGLLIPADAASIPYYVVVTACIVAILAVKFPSAVRATICLTPAGRICVHRNLLAGAGFQLPAPMQELAVAGEVAAKPPSARRTT